jgi:signal transduction histidine kinase
MRPLPVPPETLSTELLGSITHALAGPLISGRVAADALRARDPADEDVRTVAESLARAATILDAVVRIGAAARPPFVEELSLDDAVRAALRRVRAAGDELEVEAGPLDRVRADESHVVAILAELLANVAQHAGPQPRARLRSVRDGDDVLLTVADLGPGLPDGIDRERPAWFSRSGSGSSRAGSGLAVAFALAAADGGAVELRDGADGGTEVTVRLPAAGTD